MISSFSLMDDDVIRDVQKDYIIAADKHRLIKSIEGPTLWDRMLAKLHVTHEKPERETSSHKAHKPVQA